MNGPLPPCRTIQVTTFRGNRSRRFTGAIRAALDDQKKGVGPGPSRLDFILYIGHAAVSVNVGATYFGFGPDPGNTPAWQVMERLNIGLAFPGLVRDDTPIFTAARNRGIVLQLMKIVVPDPTFQKFAETLDGERQKSQYSYGFPNGQGDCNCVTWLERLSLPLLTGRMDEFARLLGWVSNPSRQFGACT
jgi:hypothetical protein